MLTAYGFGSDKRISYDFRNDSYPAEFEWASNAMFAVWRLNNFCVLSLRVGNESELRVHSESGYFNSFSYTLLASGQRVLALSLWQCGRLARDKSR